MLVYIVGTDPSTGEQVRVTSDGELKPVRESDNVDDGFTDYSIPLGDGDTGLSLPFMSGRIYFALDAKLRFKAVADGAGRPALQYPAGWVPSDPNYGVLHDSVEFPTTNRACTATPAWWTSSASRWPSGSPGSGSRPPAR